MGTEEELQDQACKKVFEALLEGRNKEARLEKLRGRKKGGIAVFSVRLGGQARLLACRIKFKGGTFLAIAKDLDDHNYQQFFAKHTPSTLQHWVKSILEPKIVTMKIMTQIDSPLIPALAYHKESVDNQLDIVSEQTHHAEVYACSELKWYSNELIELNDEQKKIIGIDANPEFPMVITGAPGTGKSLVAFFFALEYVEKLLENGPLEKKILYLVDSTRLMNQCKHTIQERDPSGKLIEQFEFQKTNDLIKMVDEKFRSSSSSSSSSVALTSISSDDLIEWLKVKVKLITKQNKTIPYSSRAKKNQSKPKIGKADSSITMSNQIFLNQIDYIPQEFRIISGCADLKQYKVMESVFFQAHEKDLMWCLYQEYLQKLKSSHQCHSDFPSWQAVQPLYHAVFADEFQNHSTGVIRVLMKLAEDNRIVMCGDPSQNLVDALTKINFLMQLSLSEIPFQSVSFNTSYRSSKLVTNVANTVLELINHFKASAPFPLMQYPEKQIDGAFCMIDDFSEIHHATELMTLRSMCQSIKTVVITEQQHIDKARSCLTLEADMSTSLIILTPEEAQGLGFETVILWDVFTDKQYNKIGDTLNPKSKKGAKNDQQKQILIPVLARLFTSLTRATHNVIIINGDKNYFSRDFNQKTKGQQTDLKALTLPEKSSEQDCLLLAETLWYKGKKASARAILINHAHYSEEQYTAWEDSFLLPIKDNVKIKEDDSSLKLIEPKAALELTTEKNKPKSKKASTAHLQSSSSSSSKSNIKAVKKNEHQPCSITVFIQTFSKESLISLINNKDTSLFYKRFLTRLYKEGQKSFYTVFEEIFINKEKMVILLEVLKENSASVRLFSELLLKTESQLHQLIRIVYKLTHSDSGCQVLHALVNNNPNNDLISTIKAHLMTLSTVIESTAQAPLFVSLCVREAGLYIFNQLLSVKEITLDMMLKRRSGQFNETAFYQLMAYNQRLYVEKKDTYSNSLMHFILAWYQESKNEPSFQNTLKDAMRWKIGCQHQSLLFYFASNQPNLDFFLMLMEDYPDLAEDISPELLYAHGRDIFSSPFFLFSRSGHGIKALVRLFKTYHSLPAGLDVDSFFLKASNDGLDKSLCCLLLQDYVGLPDIDYYPGSHLINQLFRIIPTFVKAIKLEHLVDVYRLDGTTRSLLHYFCTTKDKRELLTTLLIANQVVAAGLTREHLDNELFSVFDCLMESDDGQLVLMYLRTVNRACEQLFEEKKIRSVLAQEIKANEEQSLSILSDETDNPAFSEQNKTEGLRHCEAEVSTASMMIDAQVFNKATSQTQEKKEEAVLSHETSSPQVSMQKDTLFYQKNCSGRQDEPFDAIRSLSFNSSAR